MGISGEGMNEDLQYAVLHEFVAPARRNLSQGSWDYLMGGAETETTLERNRLALDSIAFRPRVLRNVENVSTSARVLGQLNTLPPTRRPVPSPQLLWPMRVRSLSSNTRREPTNSSISPR